MKTAFYFSRRKLRVTILWLAAAIISLLSARAHINDVLQFPETKKILGPASPDAWERLSIVRDWISGGRFFDHFVQRTNAPVGLVQTHWTRPVDIFLRYLFNIMPSNFSVDKKLMLAATFMPVILAFFTFGWLAKAGYRNFKSIHVAALAGLLFVFSTIAEGCFTPGDADHHGLLVMLWCGALWCLMRELIPLSAIMLGSCLGLMIWVSPEGLMMTGLVFALLGCEALINPAQAKNLRHAAVAAAATVTAALFVEWPAEKIVLIPSYDRISVVQMTLLWLVAGGAYLLENIFGHAKNYSQRIFGAVISAALVLLAMHGIYPKFFEGPFVDVDPFVIKQFLPRIKEAMPLVWRGWPEITAELAAPALAAILLAVAFIKGKRPARRRRTFYLSALLLATFGMTLWQVRCGYFMQPVAIISIATVLPAIAGKWRMGIPRGWRSYPVVLLWLGFFTWFGTLKPPIPVHENAYCMMQIRHVLQDGELEKILGQKNLVLLTHEDEAGDVLFFTPYSIIAGNYHREGEGMRAINDILYADSAAKAHALLKERKVGAILACHTRYREKSWLRKAGDAKKFPVWLKPEDGLHFLDIQGPKPLLLKIKP